MSDAASQTTIVRLSAVTEPEIRGLADVLIDCVEGGASVNFMHPLSPGPCDTTYFYKVLNG